ncbi:MAG: helix-turn-helix transcriptional regulator [Actinobacteria bacterium]|nr:MAG: helix-turn-helix transcriptional regulator [Actinomycetota bacterium]
MSTIDQGDRGSARASLGFSLRAARTALGLSLQEVSGRAGCSSAYVHKLEMDRVRTPSPRVLGGLAEALGLGYGDLMRAAGYDAAGGGPPPRPPGAIKRYSNAHIVQLLEALQGDVADLKSLLGSQK